MVLDRGGINMGGLLRWGWSLRLAIYLVPRQRSDPGLELPGLFEKIDLRLTKLELSAQIVDVFLPLLNLSIG